MTKVHPNAAALSAASSSAAAAPDPICEASGSPVVLTVWKKSLLPNCNGFTVFDGQGNLVFRVDNYVAGRRGETVLMDSAGEPLKTIRRKKLSFGDNWMVYDGESTVGNPRFTARKLGNLLNSKCLVQVSSVNSKMKAVLYEIEGSYVERCCAVYDDKRRLVAEIKRKDSLKKGVAFGGDVFRLIVYPELDTSVAMSLVILLDHMFGTSSSSLRFPA